MESENMKQRIKNWIVRWWSVGVSGISYLFRDSENEMDLISLQLLQNKIWYQILKKADRNTINIWIQTERFVVVMTCLFHLLHYKYILRYNWKYSTIADRDIIKMAWYAWSDCKNFWFKGFQFTRQNVDKSKVLAQLGDGVILLINYPASSSPCFFRKV